MSGETKQRLTDLEVENARLRNEQPTLRDQFAMAALTGMLAKGQTEDRNGFYLAKESYRIANAMMEVRDGTQN